MTPRISLLVAIVCACHPAAPDKPHDVDRATVPLLVEGNRPLIDVTFRKADGSTRTGRFVVHSGGGGFLLVEPLAKELGMTWGPAATEDGEQIAPATSPVTALVKDFPLALDAKRVFVLVGQISFTYARTCAFFT